MTNRAFVGAALAATLLAGTALAQAPAPQAPAAPPATQNTQPPAAQKPAATPPAAQSPAPPARTDGPAATDIRPNSDPNAPFPGANSFTEEQARERIERAGMSAVTGLTLDDKGIWRGKAVRGADPVDVSVDYRGNVVAR